MDESGSDYSGSLFSLHLQFAGTPAVPKPRAIAVAPVARIRVLSKTEKVSMNLLIATITKFLSYKLIFFWEVFHK
jgi:hypothetical protein